MEVSRACMRWVLRRSMLLRSITLRLLRIRSSRVTSSRATLSLDMPCHRKATSLGRISNLDRTSLLRRCRKVQSRVNNRKDNEMVVMVVIPHHDKQ